MMNSSIKSVGVVGTGVIGASWTALFLSHGKKVIVCDPADGAEQKLRDYINRMWPVIAKADGASPDNFTFVGASLSKEHLSAVEFVQENGPERLELKRKLLSDLDRNSGKCVPICSSSSGLVPSELIRECTNSPERIMVGHPWNPPHLIPFLEIVPHEGTSTDMIRMAKDFYVEIGKKPVVLKREAPGFIGNRLQAAISREAYSLVANGICDPEDVELAMTQGLGPRWALTGPFMTNIFAAGGNPRGYSQNAERLGPAVRSWLVDMDKMKSVETDSERRREVTELIESRLGQVDTQILEQQRDAVLVKLLKERSEYDALENYASSIKK